MHEQVPWNNRWWRTSSKIIHRYLFLSTFFSFCSWPSYVIINCLVAETCKTLTQQIFPLTVIPTEKKLRQHAQNKDNWIIKRTFRWGKLNSDPIFLPCVNAWRGAPVVESENIHLCTLLMLYRWIVIYIEANFWSWKAKRETPILTTTKRIVFVRKKAYLVTGSLKLLTYV